MQAGLVSEGARTDVGLARIRHDVGDLGDRVRDPGCFAQCAVRQHPQAALELEVRHQRHEIGIAGSLAVAVERPLDVSRARVDRGEGVGDRATGVVVAVDAEPDTGRVIDGRDDLTDIVGKQPAVRVAQRDQLRASFGSRPHYGQRIRRIAAVTVEEVLGVEEDAAAKANQERHRVAHHREVLRPWWSAALARRGRRDSSRPASPPASRPRPGPGSAGRPSTRTSGRRVAPNAARLA